MDTLNEVHKAALLTLADACNWSLHAHVPIETVTRKVASHLRGDMKKAIRHLSKKGYCLPHPTGGTITWELTRMGLQTALALVGKPGAHDAQTPKT